MPTADNPLRFLHISDTHIHPDSTYNKSYGEYSPIIGAKAMVDVIVNLPFTPDLILHTGDVAYDPDPHVYDAVLDVMSPIDVPVYYLVGNHDDGQALQRSLMQRSENDLQEYLHYEFEAKGVQFVCLDSNGPHDPTQPSGSVTSEQLDWLDAICNSDDERPLVVAIHHNVIPMYVPWMDDWMRLENGEAVHEILRQARDRLCGVFYGHCHQNLQTLRDGVLYLSAGSSWCQFTSYPDPSNERIIYNDYTLPSFNMVTITDSMMSVIRHSFEIPES